MARRFNFPKYLHGPIRRLSKKDIETLVDELLRQEIQIANSIANGHKVMAQKLWCKYEIEIEVSPTVSRKWDKAMGRFAPGVPKQIRLIALTRMERRIREIIANSTFFPEGE